MSLIICCQSFEHLRWFLKHTDVSVVCASSIAWDIAFPKELRAALLKEHAVPDFAVATTDDLFRQLQRNFATGAILVFKGEALVGTYLRPFDELTEAFAKLLSTSTAKYEDERRKRILTVAAMVRSAATARSKARSGEARNPDLSNPYEVLELEPTATMDEIETAYRKQMLLYHPDRICKFGKKLQALAEAQTKTINQAYEAIKVQHKRTSAL